MVSPPALTEEEALEDVFEVAMPAHSFWAKPQSLPEADHSIVIIFFERQRGGT